MRLRKWGIIGLILSFVLVLAACGGGGGASDAGNTANAGSSEEAITLKVAFYAGTEHAQYGVIEEFGKELEEATNGRVKLEMYPGGALASAADSYDAVVTNIADIAWFNTGYTPGQFPLTDALNLPFVPGDSSVSFSKTIQQYYDQYAPVQDEYKNVKLLWLHATDPYQIITTGKQVKTVEDLKGLKLRTHTSEAAQLVEAWGAVPISMSMNDLYDAIQKGVVDGAVIPLAAVVDHNLQDVIDYVTLGHFYSSSFGVAMNKDVWDSLDPEIQQVIESLAGEARAVKSGEAFDASLEKAYQLFEEKGIEVYELPEEELSKLREAAQGVVDKWISDKEAQGLPGHEAYETLKQIAEANN